MTLSAVPRRKPICPRQKANDLEHRTHTDRKTLLASRAPLYKRNSNIIKGLPTHRRDARRLFISDSVRTAIVVRLVLWRRRLLVRQHEPFASLPRTREAAMRIQCKEALRVTGRRAAEEKTGFTTRHAAERAGARRTRTGVEAAVSE